MGSRRARLTYHPLVLHSLACDMLLVKVLEHAHPDLDGQTDIPMAMRIAMRTVMMRDAVCIVCVEGWCKGWFLDNRAVSYLLILFCMLYLDFTWHATSTS